MDFDDNPEFNRKADVIKKIGVTLIILIVTAGLCGAFGYARWTKIRTGDAEGFYIEYEKFLHATKETEMKIAAPPSEDGAVAISIERKYFELVSIVAITPEAGEIVCDEKGYTFYFPAEGSNSKHITLSTKGKKMGCIHAAVKSGASELIIEQVIYP